MKFFPVLLLLCGSISLSAQTSATSLAQKPAVQAALQWVAKHEPELLEEQVRVCEIPAPTFAETARGAYVREQFEKLGLTDVRVDEVGNVLGTRPGRSAAPLVVLAAHLDTVFPAGTDTRVKRDGALLKAPGIADNSRGVALLLGVARALNENNIETEGTLVFVANVGEEGLGDLRGVRHLFQKTLAGQITHFVGLDGTGLGATSEAVGSNRYRVTFQAAGGHSYGAFGLVNPIHALGRTVAKISQWQVPENPKTTFNVGKIEGGTSVNAIAQSAWFEMDMRSVSANELAKLDARFHGAVEEAVAEENAFWKEHARNPIARVTNTGSPLVVSVDAVGKRPTGKTDEKAPILEAVRRANAALGIESKFEAGSTDSNLPISLGIPAVTLRTGGDGRGYHALQEDFNTTQSHLGTQRALLVVLEVVGVKE